MRQGDETPHRTYERSWEDIEAMLDAAEAKQQEWKEWFERCREAGDRDGMKDAARNHKALEGVIKTLGQGPPRRREAREGRQEEEQVFLG
mgnify:CR=1 FL=1